MSKKRYSIDEFIIKANLKYNNKFDYSKSVYKNVYSEIEIICNIHQSFWQIPRDHFNGNNCPKCSNIISKPEIEWLNYINIPNEFRQKTLKINNKLYKCDAFNPITNTVYEFNGDYWHGNPKIYNANDINKVAKKTFGQLYEKTINKQNNLINNGYNVVSIWEYDWNKIKKSVI